MDKNRIRGDAERSKRATNREASMAKAQAAVDPAVVRRRTPGWSRDLDLLNCPLRTRMPGGVAGVP
jgi:hypothetical protein